MRGHGEHANSTVHRTHSISNSMRVADKEWGDDWTLLAFSAENKIRVRVVSSASNQVSDAHCTPPHYCTMPHSTLYEYCTLPHLAMPHCNALCLSTVLCLGTAHDPAADKLRREEESTARTEGRCRAVSVQYPGGMLGKSVCCIRAVSEQYPCCIRAISAQYPEARNITLMCSILLCAVSLIVYEQYVRIRLGFNSKVQKSRSLYDHKHMFLWISIWPASTNLEYCTIMAGSKDSFISSFSH